VATKGASKGAPSCSRSLQKRSTPRGKDRSLAGSRDDAESALLLFVSSVRRGDISAKGLGAKPLKFMVSVAEAMLSGSDPRRVLGLVSGSGRIRTSQQIQRERFLAGHVLMAASGNGGKKGLAFAEVSHAERVPIKTLERYVKNHRKWLETNFGLAALLKRDAVWWKKHGRGELNDLVRRVGPGILDEQAHGLDLRAILHQLHNAGPSAYNDLIDRIKGWLPAEYSEERSSQLTRFLEEEPKKHMR
jgi:hypothetical protein